MLYFVDTHGSPALSETETEEERIGYFQQRIRGEELGGEKGEETAAGLLNK